MRAAWRIAATLAVVSALLAASAAALAAGTGAPEPRIVNGGEVSIDDHPWQVFLDIFRGQDEFSCGGSIRDATHVVTAAHCVVNPDGDYPAISAPGDLQIGYGSANIGSLTYVDVAAVTVDPRYERVLDSNAYDDAVLTLASPIPFGSGGAAPQAIPFASEQELDDAFDSGGFVTGWGTTKEGGQTPADDNLRGAAVPLQNDASCDFEYGDAYFAALMICAGGSGTDTCQGDSGGPLTIDTDPGSGVLRKLVGITSGGHGCGRPGVPGYYTWVQSPEIQQVIANPSPEGAPTAPDANPTVSGVLRVGRTVTCNPPVAAGANPTQYFWYRHTQAAGFVSLGRGRTITLPQSAFGSRVDCDVRYESPGGFAYKETPAAAFAGPVDAAAFLAGTKVALSLPSSRIPAARPLPVRVSNANNFRVTGSLSGRSASKLSTKSGARHVAVGAGSFSAGARKKPIVKLELPSVIQSALERHGQVKLDLAASVRDPAGHVRTVRRTVTVKKR
ncbi:MAG: S1 family serine peptidase [Thermoleophilaceae bacterium]